MNTPHLFTGGFHPAAPFPVDTAQASGFGMVTPSSGVGTTGIPAAGNHQQQQQESVPEAGAAALAQVTPYNPSEESRQRIFAQVMRMTGTLKTNKGSLERLRAAVLDYLLPRLLRPPPASEEGAAGEEKGKGHADVQTHEIFSHFYYLHRDLRNVPLRETDYFKCIPEFLDLCASLVHTYRLRYLLDTSKVGEKTRDLHGLRFPISAPLPAPPARGSLPSSDVLQLSRQLKPGTALTLAQALHLCSQEAIKEAKQLLHG